MGMPIKKKSKTNPKKYIPSASETKREYAMEERARTSRPQGMKEIGKKAKEQRVVARRIGTAEKNREKAAAKRGGSMPANSSVKKRTYNTEPTVFMTVKPRRKTEIRKKGTPTIEGQISNARKTGKGILKPNRPRRGA
jgi:hypothetical protein